MKLSLTVLGLLASVNVHAVPLKWQDLDRDSRPSLSQNISLKGTRGETIRLRKNQALTLEEVYPLSGLSVMYYLFRESPCATPELESEMELVLPIGSTPGREVGVSSVKGCGIEMFVEAKDLANPSFFHSNSER